MPAHLLANSVFALLLVRPTPRRAAAAGTVGSIAQRCTPGAAYAVAVPWLTWVASRRGRTRL